MKKDALRSNASCIPVPSRELNFHLPAAPLYRNIAAFRLDALHALVQREPRHRPVALLPRPLVVPEVLLQLLDLGLEVLEVLFLALSECALRSPVLRLALLYD